MRAASYTRERRSRAPTPRCYHAHFQPHPALDPASPTATDYPPARSATAAQRRRRRTSAPHERKARRTACRDTSTGLRSASADEIVQPRRGLDR